jgi:hypothetical protein
MRTEEFGEEVRNKMLIVGKLGWAIGYDRMAFQYRNLQQDRDDRAAVSPLRVRVAEQH